MSIRYYNQTAPFWDFVASFEDQNSRAAPGGGDPEAPEVNVQGPPAPPEGPWGSFPFMFGGPRGGHHGRGGRHHSHGRHGHHRRGGPRPPSPPPPPPQPPHPHDEGSSESSDEHDGGPEAPGHEHHSGPHHGHGARHGPPPFAGHRGPGGRGGRCGRGRGRHGPPGFGPMGPLGGLAEMFQSQFFGGGGEEGPSGRKDESFRPEVDVFDTPESFVVHLSLPGAKKEDVAVNWDAEKSALSIAGVIHRPGDEELLSHLALDERSIGHFDRKVHLGSRAHPAQVDVDGIVAKLEDGVLRVNVPKLDSGYVEIKKVDVE